MAAADNRAGAPRLPLAGLRVLDFSHAAAAPFATMFLGDMGADVIKVERPGYGDGARSMGVPMTGPRESDYYVSVNRNKRGVVIDLQSPEGVDVAKRLAARSDIVVENFRPAVMPQLGLGFADLAKLRPGLVYCSISAFGANGPWSDRPANDIIMQSVSGLMGITGERGGGPVRIGAPISDFSSGLFALSGILAALHARDEHPEGQHIEISMLEASLNMMCNYIPSVASLGHTVPRLGRGHAQIVPYQAFMCADGQYVMVGAFTRQFWLNLCKALGREDWTRDPRYETNALRLKHRTELIGELEAIFGAKPRDAWLTVLETADVPCSPVYELHDAIKSAPVVHEGSLRSLGSHTPDVKVVRSPIRVDQWGDEPCRDAPSMGAHSREVLKEVLGVPDAEVETLIARGIVRTGPQEKTRK